MPCIHLWRAPAYEGNGWGSASTGAYSNPAPRAMLVLLVHRLVVGDDLLRLITRVQRSPPVVHQDAIGPCHWTPFFDANSSPVFGHDCLMFTFHPGGQLVQHVETPFLESADLLQVGQLHATTVTYLSFPWSVQSSLPKAAVTRHWRLYSVQALQRWFFFVTRASPQEPDEDRNGACLPSWP